MKSRIIYAVLTSVLVVVLTWFWQRTQSLNPEDNYRIDSALQELRSLDRTINQDVLKARFQLIETYYPVLQSYRRIESLESSLRVPPEYLTGEARIEWFHAIDAYQRSVTSKQRRIETFKYRSADLKDLLAYLPGAGTGVAQAVSVGPDAHLAQKVNQVLQLALLYNLTSDEKYAPTIRSELDRLSLVAEQAQSAVGRRRIRTLIINVHRLLTIKPDVDHLLREIFDEPVIRHEEQVARLYYRNFSQAERIISHYRFGLYAICVALVALVAMGIRRLRMNAVELALANENLEERVAARTQELTLLNQDMRLVLDNVDQALFTVDLEGHISRERSATLERWFPQATPNSAVWKALGSVDNEAVHWLELGWDQLREGNLPQAVLIDQLPKDLKGSERHYELKYIPIAVEDQLQKLLVVVTDVTERDERVRSEQDFRMQALIVQQLFRDRSGFLEFVAEGRRMVDSILQGQDSTILFRSLHTLNGNCSAFGLSDISATLHKLESDLLTSGSTLNCAQKKRISDTWEHFEQKVNSLTVKSEDGIELSRGEFQTLSRILVAKKCPKEVLSFLRYLEREPVERRLRHLSDYAKHLAHRLRKGDIDVTIEANGVRLDAGRWAPFWSAFVHAIRNAVDHGLESEDQRAQLGKPTRGRLDIRVRTQGRAISVELEDDGRGFDWDALQVKAKQLGIEASGEDQLLERVRVGGLTTKATATEFSGRGAGFSACHQTCRDLGGTLIVKTVKGKGTLLEFQVPDDLEQPGFC